MINPLRAVSFRGWVVLGVIAALLIFWGLVAKSCADLRGDKAVIGAEAGKDAGAARELEGEGRATIDNATAAARTAAEEQRSADNELNRQAGEDPAARQQLPPSVRDRVRAGDERLCQSGVSCR